MEREGKEKEERNETESETETREENQHIEVDDNLSLKILIKYFNHLIFISQYPRTIYMLIFKLHYYNK